MSSRLGPLYDILLRSTLYGNRASNITTVDSKVTRSVPTSFEYTLMGTIKVRRRLLSFNFSSTQPNLKSFPASSILKALWHTAVVDYYFYTLLRSLLYIIIWTKG